MGRVEVWLLGAVLLLMASMLLLAYSVSRYEARSVPDHFDCGRVQMARDHTATLWDCR